MNDEIDNRIPTPPPAADDAGKPPVLNSGPRLHWIARLCRGTARTGLTLLVLLALYLSAGRLLWPLVAGQTTNVEAQLSRMLNARVDIGELRGSWFRFSPGLDVVDLRIIALPALAADPAAGNPDAVAPQHLVNHAFISLDVLQSLMHRQPVINRIAIDGMQLAVERNANGRWTLSGLSPGDGVRKLLNSVFDTPHIAITESSLVLDTGNGAIVHLDELYLDLQNRDQQHELRMQFAIDEQPGPTQLLVSMTGDPRADFSASVYGSADDLALAPLTAMLPALSNEWALENGAANANVWLEIDQRGLQRAIASVSDLRMQATAAQANRSIDLANAGFLLHLQPLGENAAVQEASGDAAPQAGWSMQLSHAAFDFDQLPWKIDTIQLDWPFMASAPITLRADALQLAMLRQLLSALVPLPAATANIVETLDPQGALHSVHLQTARDGSYPGGFLLRGNLRDGAVQAWNAAPSGSGLQGYIELDGNKGFAEVDSTAVNLHLPRLFNRAWEYNYLNARVLWQYDDAGFSVYSTPIAVRNSGLQGQVQFDLRHSRDAGSSLSDFSLLVGMQSMDVAMRDAYLPTLENVGETMAWLETALQGGELRNSGFVLRTASRNGETTGSNTFATWYDVHDGRLKFLPDWPALEDIQASVDVRDGQVEVRAEAASIAGIALRPTFASVQPRTEGGSMLLVRGNAMASTDAGLAFLQNTPVRQTIGPVLEDWEASGQIDIDIGLDIPLGANATPPDIVIDVLSTQSELHIPQYSLSLGGINGRITYHSDAGLAATALSATLFDSPIVANIATVNDAVNGLSTRINSTGRASVAALKAWPAQAEFVRGLLDFLEGEIEYSAQLDILNRDDTSGTRSRLTLFSELRGLQSRFPEPFAKNIDDIATLDLSMAFMDDTQVLTTRYDDLLSGQIVLSASGIERGQFYLGDRNRNFTLRQSNENEPGLLVNGDLPYLDFAEWRQVADDFRKNTAADANAQTLADYLRLVDVNVGTLNLAGQELQDINVQIEHGAESWHIRAYNALLSGALALPDDDTMPWLIDLDYLRFPASDEAEQQGGAEAAAESAEVVDLLSTIDPAQLPPFDFSTAELAIGSRSLGAFSFQLRPYNNGASIANVRMQAADASISDMAGTGGANIDWRYREGMHNSSFNGLFAAGNLASVLASFGQDTSVESDSARFSGTLQWSGSPLAFSPSTASGQILMDINDGRFANIESGSSRLMGALNFDSLVRRLQLDFSDLFQRGFAFDRISGNLNFDEGVVITNGGVIIVGPSSRISINGEIDLAAETIAADMQVRIPLGQNISMLAGLLGAWPIAVSTYLASKIFQEQVEDFATVIYRLEGPWDKPNAGFQVPPDGGDAASAGPASKGRNEAAGE